MRRELARSWPGLLGALVGVAGVLVLSVCASPQGAAKGPRDEPVEVKRSELERLRAEAARAVTLEQRLSALEREHREALVQLRVAQQRLRLAPFDPTTLSGGDFALKLPEAQKLEARRGKARRTSLARTLADTRRGMVIAYWATWCKPCTAPDELQRLTRLRGELASQGADLVFLAVDELDKVVADPRADGWLYPLWQRDDGHIEMLPEAFVRKEGLDLPLMLVVAKNGRVRWVRKGALDDEAATDILTAVIRGD